MGANASKEDGVPSEVATTLNLMDDTSNDKAQKFSELLVEPAVKRRFDDLLKLVKHNSMNDINYLARNVASFQKEKLPVLLYVSKMYSQMLQEVRKMNPEFKSEGECFNFLADDHNVLKFFYWQSGSDDDAVIQGVIADNKNTKLEEPIKAFMNSLRGREARLRYYQFKYAQTALFQASFVQSMWLLSNVFVQSTQAFHRLRETVFGSVFKQMSAIVQKYTGADDISLKDVDELDKLTKKLNSVRSLSEIKDKMENQKMTSIKELLQDLIKMDSEIVENPDMLLPIPPGVMKGIAIGPSGVQHVQVFKPTGWNKDAVKIEIPAQKSDESDDDYKKKVERIQKQNKLLSEIVTPDNLSQLEALKDMFTKDRKHHHKNDKKDKKNNRNRNRNRNK